MTPKNAPQSGPHIALVSLLDEMRCFGALYLAACLREKGVRTSLLFLPLKTGKRESDEEVDLVLSYFARQRPDAVGFSLMTCQALRARRLTEALRRRMPEVAVVWGGVHPTLCPEESIEYADAVCVGEGEDALVELVDAWWVGGRRETAIQNMWFRADGTVVRNPQRRLRVDLDSLPFPFHDFASSQVLHRGRIVPLTHGLYRHYMNWQGQAYSIVTTRGCPFHCSYCCNSALKQIYVGTYLRRRSVPNVIEEIAQARRVYPYTGIVNIQDDSFILNDDDWLAEFCRAYKAAVGLPLICRLIPVMATDARLAMLKEAGLQWAIAGLQSGSERINQGIYNRKTTNRDFLECAKRIHRHGIFGIYDVILDGPFDTEEDVLKTLDVIQQIPKPFSLQVFSMILFPKTKLKELCDREGIPSNADPYEQGLSRIKETYLNKLVMIAPFSPRALVRFFVERRRHRYAQILLDRYYSLYLAVFVNSRTYLRHFKSVPKLLKALNRAMRARRG